MPSLSLKYMTKLTVTFRNSANAPKNHVIARTHHVLYTHKWFSLLHTLAFSCWLSTTETCRKENHIHIYYLLRMNSQFVFSNNKQIFEVVFQVRKLSPRPDFATQIATCDALLEHESGHFVKLALKRHLVMNAKCTHAWNFDCLFITVCSYSNNSAKCSEIMIILCVLFLLCVYCCLTYFRCRTAG